MQGHQSYKFRTRYTQSPGCSTLTGDIKNLVQGRNSQVSKIYGYLGYSIFRYFENIRPGGNGGGWVDTAASRFLDRYAEQLWLTNGIDSILEFNSGTLHSQTTVVSNAQSCVVGDGVASGNFHLVGGVHSFQNGLHIRTNSFLTGCGTVNGSVVVDAGGAVHANCTNLVFNSALTNNGTIVVDGAVLETFGTFVNNGKMFLLNGGTTNLHGTFVNNGAILNGKISLTISQDGSSGFFVRYTGAPVQLPAVYRVHENGVWLSFTDARLGRGGEFIGLENYEFLRDDSVFWLSVFNTLLYTSVASIIKFAVGLYLALLLNERLPFKAVIRAVVLIPFIVPTVLSAIAFWWLYDPQFSIISWSLRKMHLISSNIDFLGDVPALVSDVAARAFDDPRGAAAARLAAALKDEGARLQLGCVDEFSGYTGIVLDELRVSRDPVALDVLSVRELESQRQRANAPVLKPSLDLYRNAALLELGLCETNDIQVERIELGSASLPDQAR